jgi:hypothetical protein
MSGSQGFTYYAAKRLGWYNSQKDSSIVYFANPSATWGSSMNQRMMYKYMIYKPGSSMSVTDAWCQVRNGSGDPLWELAKTGLNNNNDLTTKAECVNQGAITSYPFKISESLTIAETHGQWYQLAMEDEDITVWYTLAYDGDSGKANGGVSYSNDVNCSGSGDHNSSGTSITYGVSPKDCANNYYIYSKGNVFYSGVGHSTVTSSEEAKLFINTMIAAYNTAFALISTPHILIDNSEATRSGSTYNYSIETRQVYDSVVSDRGGNAQSADGSLTGSRTITFYPKDDSGSGLIGAVYYKESDTRYIYFNKNGTLKVYDLNGDYVADAPATAADMKVYDATTGTEVTWTDDLHFKMEIGHKYYIKYYNQYLSGSASIPKYREVGFDISNSDQQSTSTKLSMTIEPLFQLD